MKNFTKALTGLCLITYAGLTYAEPYVSASLGWGFDQKLKSITGDENLNYPDAINAANGSFFPNTKYSNINLKEALQGGVKAGYFFEFASNLWIPVDISKFRSANNLSADLEMQSVNLVLTRHF